MDYTQLKADLAALLNRSDLTANIPGFIVLAEAQFNRDIRHWRMENRAYITTSGQYIPLPTDWLETQRVFNASDEIPMQLMSRQAMQESRYNASIGVALPTCPTFYRHSEGNYELWPAPTSDVNIEAEYYQRIPSLSSTVTSNWLLTYNPDIYLYGAAMHSAPFLIDDPRLATWSTLYGTAMQQLNRESERAEVSQSSPRLLRIGMRQS